MSTDSVIFYSWLSFLSVLLIAFAVTFCKKLHTQRRQQLADSERIDIHMWEIETAVRP